MGDILVIALSAVLSGAESWDSIADFGVAKQDWLLSLGLLLPNGIPSHDTFNRVFAALDPVAFQRCFRGWISAVCAAVGLRHVPVDGKALRGSRGPGGTCLHTVSAFAADQRLTLAQVQVADKSNEITAIPEVLAMLQLKGALVSIDAIGCQKGIARQIRAAEADYLLAVKDNQETLADDVAALFERAHEGDFAGLGHDRFTTEEVGHGRYERREYYVVYEPAGLSTLGEWADLRCVVQVVRVRRVGGKESDEVAYYISSRAASAELLAEGVRAHWGIENTQHWCLDVLFGEDLCRTRHQNAAQNLAWLRRMALGLLRQDQSKGSAPTKRLRAALCDDFRRHLLDLLSAEYA